MNSFLNDILDESTVVRPKQKIKKQKKLNEAVVQTKDGKFVTLKARSAPEDGGEIVIDRPSAKQIKTAVEQGGIDVNNYDVTSYLGYGQLLYDLGITDHVPRSTKVTTRKSITKDISKWQTIIGKFLSTFKNDDPIELVQDALNNSKQAIVDKTGFSPDICLNKCKSWEELTDIHNLIKLVAPYVRGEYGSDREQTKKKAFDDTMRHIAAYSGSTDNLSDDQRKSGLNAIKNNIGSNYKEGDDEEYQESDFEVQKVKEVVRDFAQIFKAAQQTGATFQQYKIRVTYASSMNTILRETRLTNILDSIKEDSGSIADLKQSIEGQMGAMSKDSGVKKDHINAWLQEQEVQYFSKVVEETGERLTPDSFFKYQSNYSAQFDKNIEAYNLSKGEIQGRFATWKEMMDYFYSPEILAIIIDRLGVKRKEGSQTAKQSSELRDLKYKEKRLVKTIAKSNKPTAEGKSGGDKVEKLKARIEAKQEEKDSALEVRDELAKQLKANPNDSELQNAYAAAKKLAFKLGKDYSALTFTLRKLGGGNVSPKAIDKIEDKLAKVQKQTVELTKEIIDSSDGVEDKDELKRELSKQQNKVIDEFGAGYNVLSFDLETYEAEVATKFTKLFTKILNGFEGEGNDYINGDCDDAEVGNGFTVYIDYPSDSKISRLLNKDVEKVYDMIDQIIGAFNKKFGRKLSYDEESLEYGDSLKSSGISEEMWQDWED